jgi:hypothetical protein
MVTTNNILTNPATNALLADTGALNGSQTSLTALISSEVACIVFFEYMNAANTVALYSHAFIIGANTSQQFDLPGLSYLVGERFRLRLNAGVTGHVQGSLFYF